MRIFTNPMEMVKEVERDLFEMGTRYQSATVQDQDVEDNPDFQTLELCGYAYTLTGFDDEQMMEMALYSGFVPHEWLLAEADERIYGPPRGCPPNPGMAWHKNSKFWGPFIRRGAFSYSYAERWQEQLPYIIEELRRHPNSRQAIMTMYDRHQDMMNWGGLDRVPCSVSYQFFIREGKMVCIYNERSCDFVKFFGADVFITVELMKYISKRIGVPPGQFVHFLGSLHAFAGDLKGKDIF